jgi:hypothetical protein
MPKPMFLVASSLLSVSLLNPVALAKDESWLPPGAPKEWKDIDPPTTKMGKVDCATHCLKNEMEGVLLGLNGEAAVALCVIKNRSGALWVGNNLGQLCYAPGIGRASRGFNNRSYPARCLCAPKGTAKKTSGPDEG